MKTLLIIDDDRHLLDSLRIVFSSAYHVLTARSAEEAEPILDVEPVDVVLLDVILPGLDGVEFLKKLRGKHPDLPVAMPTIEDRRFRGPGRRIEVLGPLSGTEVWQCKPRKRKL